MPKVQEAQPTAVSGLRKPGSTLGKLGGFHIFPQYIYTLLRVPTVSLKP